MQTRLLVILLFSIADLVCRAEAAAARLRASALASEARANASLPTDESLAVPSCSCSCCRTTFRMKHEMKEESNFMKCALDESSSVDRSIDPKELTNAGVAPMLKSATEVSKCSAHCDKRTKEELPKIKTPMSTDYNQYCFYYCKPYDFAPGQVCLELSPEERRLSSDANGNPIDLNLKPLTAVAAGQVTTSTEPPVVQVTTPKCLHCELENELFKINMARAKAMQASNDAADLNEQH
mmetsp:Transcript_49454/g.87074  ORF Transcript_49454/g.87074 Transcript_49454/m.87074 type:complete len:238 (+) Transcript_49454:149-862(+)